MTKDNTRQTLVDGLVIEEQFEPYTQTAVAPSAPVTSWPTPATLPPRPLHPAF